MAIFILQIKKNKLVMTQRELLASGALNVYHVQFQFSPDWDGLTRTAVFKAGTETRSILLDDTNACVIPWEVLTRHSLLLMAGVYGTQGGELVLPTVWVSLGTILEGVTTGGDARPPTPDLWEQALARKGDALCYTESGQLGLYAGDKLLSAVPVQGSGGEGPAWGIGHGLKLVGGDLAVDSVNDFHGDNTLPMTAAGVQTVVGNIEVLLGTI